MFKLFNFIIPFVLLFKSCALHDACVSKVNGNELSDSCIISRYILYDVNFAEGFNLRRDVYIRLAVWIKQLERKRKKWNLVLPPWNQLYHWQSMDIGVQKHLPWNLFFNVTSLKEYSPVMELGEFFAGNKNVQLDYIIILQYYEDIWSDKFVWEDKWSFNNCSKPHNYVEVDENLFMGRILGYDNITASRVECVSFHGPASMLTEVVDSLNGRTILFEHAEIVLHDNFGGIEYWKCRKSMKFAPHLIVEAKRFMSNELNVSTTPDADVPISNDKNLPYICVHLRRKDFLRAYHKEVPSMKWAAHQIKIKLQLLNVSCLFIATDSAPDEFNELKAELPNYKFFKYNPDIENRRRYKDGGIAIVDQIICSYARYFIGTHQSTFSFRIQEEREILGFQPSTTFNRLCGTEILDCSQPAKWLIDNAVV